MQKSDFAKEMAAIQIALEAIASIDEENRSFAIETITKRLKIKTISITDADNGEDGGSPTRVQESKQKNILSHSPKQFMALKKPNTEVQQIACLAYYLTHNRNQAHFKTAELTKLNTEAAARKLSNPSKASDHAVWQYHYLAQAGKGNRQITTFGEDIVSALPDLEKVKLITLANKSPRRKGLKKSKSSKKDTAKA